MNTFKTAVSSLYSTHEVCLNPTELEDKMFHQSFRAVENRTIRHIDTNPEALKEMRARGIQEKQAARQRGMCLLDQRHQFYLEDTRNALFECNSIRALYVLIDEMADHDKALEQKAGKPICDTFAELEILIITTEQRIRETASNKASLQQSEVEKPIINHGADRLEKVHSNQIKTKLSPTTNTYRDIPANGWKTAAHPVQ
jgi:hypothetical protein